METLLTIAVSALTTIIVLVLQGGRPPRHRPVDLEEVKGLLAGLMRAAGGSACTGPHRCNSGSAAEVSWCRSSCTQCMGVDRVVPCYRDHRQRTPEAD